VKVSDQLCKIIPSWDVSDSEMKQFCSETAPRVSAQDVVDNIAGAPCFSGE